MSARLRPFSKVFELSLSTDCCQGHSSELRLSRWILQDYHCENSGHFSHGKASRQSELREIKRGQAFCVLPRVSCFVVHLTAMR